MEHDKRSLIRDNNTGKGICFFVNCTSFIVSVFFIYTGVFKLLQAESFRLNISRTGFFPEYLIPYMPYFVASVELIVAFVVIARAFVGHLLFTTVMLAFSFYITYLNNNGLYEVCGCGGILNGLGYSSHLTINIVSVILSLAVIFVQTTTNTVQTKIR